MSSANPTTSYGSYTNHRRVKLVISWNAPALGATSVTVTVKGYLDPESSWNVSDSNNSSSVTINGSRNTSQSWSEGSTSFSGDGVQLFQTESKSIAISQTAATTVACSASLAGVETIGGTISESYTITIDASGVPYSHPTAVAFSSYDYSKTGGVTNTTVNNIVYTATGGLSWGVSSTGTLTAPSIASFGAVSVVKSGQSIYVRLSSTQIDLLIAKWNTDGYITSPAITFTTTASGLSNTTWTSKTATIPAIKDLYTISSFSAYRDGSASTTVKFSMLVTSKTSSPYYQAGVWPGSTIFPTIVRFKKGTTLETGTVSTTSTSSTSRYYTATSTSTLADNASQAYSGLIYVSSVAQQTLSKTVAALQSFLAMRKVTANTGYLGINNGAPTCALDVTGNVKINGVDITPVTYSHVRADSASADGLATGGTGSVVIYDAVIYDALGEYNNTTGIFTATYAGYYRISASVLIGSTAWTAGESFMLRAYANGDTTAGIRWACQVTGNHYASSSIDVCYYLAAGATASVNAYHTQGGSLAVHINGDYNHLNIDRIG